MFTSARFNSPRVLTGSFRWHGSTSRPTDTQKEVCLVQQCFVPYLPLLAPCKQSGFSNTPCERMTGNVTIRVRVFFFRFLDIVVVYPGVCSWEYVKSCFEV